jgi:hypothetical protein
MSDFNQLKRNRSEQLTKLTSEVSKLSSVAPDSRDDDKFWKPEVDKAGNGFAVIRFLPAPTNEDVPFVRVWDHGFKGLNGQWYIEKSLTTLGQQDPVSEYNTQLWNSTTDDNSPQRKQVRDQKRRLTFISNIYVVKDTANPQNEGKVFLFKYGKKIFDKLNDAMNPQFPDEAPINPFDLWEGANFKLKIRNVEGYRNYDQSSFDAPAPLSDDDGQLESIWKQEHSLQEFVDPKNFKSYDELKAKLYRVLGLDGAVVSRPVTTAESSPPWDDAEEFTPPPVAKTKPAPSIPAVTEDDDDADFFKRLAEED